MNIFAEDLMFDEWSDVVMLLLGYQHVASHDKRIWRVLILAGWDHVELPVITQYTEDYLLDNYRKV